MKTVLDSAKTVLDALASEFPLPVNIEVNGGVAFGAHVTATLGSQAVQIGHLLFGTCGVVCTLITNAIDFVDIGVQHVASQGA